MNDLIDELFIILIAIVVYLLSLRIFSFFFIKDSSNDSKDCVTFYLPHLFALFISYFVFEFELFI